jgi:hypothetical protein
VGSRPASEELEVDSRSIVVYHIIFVGFVVQGCGGGEVSGGGTLYMKWGAGRNSATRVLKARADRETHTH